MKLIDISSKINWKFICAVFILAVLAGGGVWWFGKKQEKRLIQEIQQLAKSQVTVHTSTPTSSINTSGWQTYRNEEYGFEVRYPDDFVSEEYPPGLRSGEEFGIEFHDQKWTTGHYPVLTISVIHTDLAPYDWVKAYREPTSQVPSGEPAVGHRNLQEILFNGRNAAKVEFISVSDMTSTTIIQGDLERVYRIDAISSGWGDFPQDIYQQILSTFRFVE